MENELSAVAIEIANDAKERIEAMYKRSGLAPELRVEQFAHSIRVEYLLRFAHEMGYDVIIGEAQRLSYPPEMKRAHVEHGNSHPQSTHFMCLAIDLTLYKDGVWMRETVEYEPLGLFWEAMGGSWGGRFDDGRHFSHEWKGVK